MRTPNPSKTPSTRLSDEDLIVIGQMLTKKGDPFGPTNLACYVIVDLLMEVTQWRALYRVQRKHAQTPDA